MDKEKYLPMTSEELYEHLISDILANVSDGWCLVNDLTAADRYQSDYEFRAFIDTAKALIFSLRRDHASLFPLCNNIIERATALTLWKLVAMNLNLMGGAYFLVDAFERALSCFQNIIKIEAEHNFLAITSIAYHNIALIYMKLEAHDKAHEYFDLALKSLESGGTNQPRYTSKLIAYLSNLIPPLCQDNRMDEIPPLLARINALDMDTAHPAMMCSYHVANMYYAFYTGKYETAKKSYQTAKTYLLEDDTILNADLLFTYVSLCGSFKLSYEFYIDELLSISTALKISRYTSTNLQVYKQLLKYYELTGNTEQLEKSTKKYIEILEQHVRDIRTNQLNSLQVVHDLLIKHEDLMEITSKNNELKLIAEEANRHKNALEEAYQRIEIINELGQKMTSSLKLNEVIDLIYRNLKKNVPVTNFALMVVEPEEQMLRTVAYYENDHLQPEFCLSLDNPNSIFVECYKQNKLILSDNIQTDERFTSRQLIQNGKNLIHSAIYMPLNVGTQIIGICTIQDQKAHVYTSKHLLFLKQILPYLAISLNNAIRSRKLEYEIRSHLKTQVKLEKANHRLELLSTLDSLTQISSRRDFDTKIVNLLSAARKQQKNLSVFMFDIDNFKIYNDTYGHLEGDVVLKKVAQVIRRNLDTAGGLSARFGGEEFIGACIGLSMAESRQLANQIRQDVYNLQIKNTGTTPGLVTLSCGVAFAEKLALVQKSELMRLADTCLYQAKNTGKNKVIIKKINEK